MARVVKGFMFGTRYGLTFYMMDGNLYVRLKSTLSRKKVKYSERFQRTMQSAGELGRASKVAARVYRELSREQRKMVYVLYKKMTGVAKIALKYGKTEEEAEREVREYVVKEGVVKPVVVIEEVVVTGPGKEKGVPVKRGGRTTPVVFGVPEGKMRDQVGGKKRRRELVSRKRIVTVKQLPMGPRKKSPYGASHCRGRPPGEEMQSPWTG